MCCGTVGLQGNLVREHRVRLLSSLQVCTYTLWASRVDHLAMVSGSSSPYHHDHHHQPGSACCRSVQSCLSACLKTQRLKYTKLYVYLLLSIREGHRWKVSENRVPRLNEVTGGWEKFHSEDVRKLYFSPDIRAMGHSGKWEMHTEFCFEVWRAEITQKTGAWLRDNINIDFKGMGGQGAVWV